MQHPAQQCLHHTLQLQQGERLGQQLEHHGAVGHLAAQPAQRRGHHAAVIDGHCEADTASWPRCGLPHQAGLVEQFVALQRAHPVPRCAREAEGDVGPLGASQTLGARTFRRPAGQRRHDAVVEHRGPAAAVVLPRQQVVHVRPGGAGERSGLVHQRQIGDRQHACAHGRVATGAVHVAERVELLHVAQVQAGLLVGEAAQRQLQRAVAGARPAGGQPGQVVAVDTEDARGATGDGQHDGLERGKGGLVASAGRHVAQAS